MSHELHHIPPRLWDALRAAPTVPEPDVEMYVRCGPRGQGEPTQAELVTLAAVSHGLTNEMAAQMLGCSVEAVKSRLRLVRYKLGAKNTVHAVAVALRRGLIA